MRRWFSIVSPKWGMQNLPSAVTINYSIWLLSGDFSMAYIYNFRDVVSERIEEMFDDIKTNDEIELMVSQAELACREAWVNWLESISSNS